MFNSVFLISRPGQPARPVSADTWFPFDTEKHYIITFLFYIYVCILDLLFVPQWNAMIISMLIYSTCMLKILQYKLRNQNRLIVTQKTFLGNVLHKERYDYFVQCIKEHLNIIE